MRRVDRAAPARRKQLSPLPWRTESMYAPIRSDGGGLAGGREHPAEQAGDAGRDPVAVGGAE